MLEEHPNRPITLARNDLYKEVWETHMSRLAATYGISGNGLAKICKQLDVPYPGRGYLDRVFRRVLLMNFLPTPRAIAARS